MSNLKSLDEVISNLQKRSRNQIQQRPVSDSERGYWADLSTRIASNPAYAAQPEVCSVCDGLGLVRYDLPRDHKDYGKLFPCPNPNCSKRQEEQQQRFNRLTLAAQIPPSYKGFTLDWWTARLSKPLCDGKRDALGAVLAFLAAADAGYFFSLEEAAAQVGLPAPEVSGRPRNSIVLSGINGVGKTSLAVAAGNALIDGGRGVVYVRMDEALERLRATFSNDAEEDSQDVMELYRTAPILIVDELTATKPTKWQVETVGGLINHRYTHQLPTLVTTNTGYDEFVEVWGLTMGTRLQHMAHWIVMSGKVLRPRAGEVTSR